MLVVMDTSTHEEHLYQPLQTNNKQFKIAVTFLTGYNGTFNVTNSNKSFYFMKSITVENGFIQTPGLISKRKLSGIISNFIMDVDPV